MYPVSFPCGSLHDIQRMIIKSKLHSRKRSYHYAQTIHVRWVDDIWYLENAYTQVAWFHVFIVMLHFAKIQRKLAHLKRDSIVTINRAWNRSATFRLTQWLKIIPHMIRSYYHCCCINEPVIFGHWIQPPLHLGWGTTNCKLTQYSSQNNPGHRWKQENCFWKRQKRKSKDQINTWTLYE